MNGWFGRTVIDTGRLPLFCFFVAFVVGFGFIRLSVRLIRAEVRWWPGNVKPGGLHIHHVVFGIGLMVSAGVAGIAIPGPLTGWRSVAAAFFGLGTALVLDEFALILHLRDVYWTSDGRLSIDAVFVAAGITCLLLLGMRPIGFSDIEAYQQDPRYPGALAVTIGLIVGNLVLAIVTLLKGKIWTGLFGLFLPAVLVAIGAIRLARPSSPWARWQYKPGSKKALRAERREARIRHPLSQGKVWIQELLSGRHDDLPSSRH